MKQIKRQCCAAFLTCTECSKSIELELLLLVSLKCIFVVLLSCALSSLGKAGAGEETL